MSQIKFILVVSLLFGVLFFTAKKTDAQCFNDGGICRDGPNPPQSSTCSSGINGFGQSCSIAAYSSNQNDVGHCLSQCNYDPVSGHYNYVRVTVDRRIGPFSCTFPSNNDNDWFVLPQLTNIYGCMMGYGSAPSGCNQDYDCEGGEGGGGSCPGTCQDNPDVPEIYWGNPCGDIPCAYRGDCGCPSCETCEGGGGGGPPSPTPTPSPYCTLFCPGVLGGGGDTGGLSGFGGGGPGTRSGSASAPTVVPPIAEGDIRYYGYNNFNCGTFQDGKWYDGPCPTQAGGGGGLSGGLSNQWAYPQKFNMLCGQSAHTYTATVQAGSGGSGGQGGLGGDQSTPTPPDFTPTPTQSQQYPPNCQIGGGGPTPTRDPGSGLDGLGNLGGSGSGANACTCSLTLSCQDRLESDPSTTGSGCTATCDYTVDPDYPIYDTAVSFETASDTPTTGISFAFDDGTDVVDDDPTVSHTFANAGVYDVALSCSPTSEVCTRRVNIYCDNGIAPSPLPSPTPTPDTWFKIKDGDFIRTSSLTNQIPATVTAYDLDDTGNPACSTSDPSSLACFNVNQAGIVGVEDTIDVGGAVVSNRDWKLENYTFRTQFTPDTIVEYVKSRKQYVTVSSDDSVIDAAELTTNRINLVTGNFTINADAVADKAPFVLLVEGNITFDVSGGVFNDENKAVAVISTGAMNITSQVTELNGIFSADRVDFASDIADGDTTDTPLKIKGSLFATNPSETTIKRDRADNSKSSIFNVGDYKKTVDLLPLLGIKSYIWREVTQ